MITGKSRIVSERYEEMVSGLLHAWPYGDYPAGYL